MDDGFLSSRSVVRGMKFASYYDYRLDFDGKPIITSHRMHDGGHVVVRVGGDE
jgi:hypothetical protein